MMRYKRKKVDTQQNPSWLDICLTEEAKEYLWDRINNSEGEDARKNLAGNISKSSLIEDKDNWFYENVLKEMTEHMFFKKSWDEYYDVYIAKIKPHPKFHLKTLWVNYQKQYEFNPPHNHGGIFSFVVFMKIPTYWKEQHALPTSANSNTPVASNFAFHDKNLSLESSNVRLSPDDEGRMLFFPAWLKHEVFPFYECEEERITISGNIQLYEPDRFKFRVKGGEYEKKKNALKMLEVTVEGVKKELEYLKKQEDRKIK